MKVHHLNGGAMRPYGGFLFDGATPGLGPANLTCHCLLLETTVGLVLVDTGTVGRDPDRSAQVINPFFRITDRVRLDPAEAMWNQVIRLGHQPSEVKHIVMTHLDFDHAAGLLDFTNAKVHLSADEIRAVRTAKTPKEHARYRTAREADPSNWHGYAQMPADFFGVPATYLEGIPGVMLVSLPGHTKGHCGVAIDLGRGQWLLHAADAIFNGRELDEDPFTPTAARMYQWMMESSQVRRRRSLAHLRRIRRDHGDHVHIICTHDPRIMEESRTERATTQAYMPRTGG